MIKTYVLDTCIWRDLGARDISLQDLTNEIDMAPCIIQVHPLSVYEILSGNEEMPGKERILSSMGTCSWLFSDGLEYASPLFNALAMYLCNSVLKDVISSYPWYQAIKNTLGFKSSVQSICHDIRADVCRCMDSAFRGHPGEGKVLLSKLGKKKMIINDYIDYTILYDSLTKEYIDGFITADKKLGIMAKRMSDILNAGKLHIIERGN